MRVANKLEPEIKSKRLKLSLGIDQSNFKSKTLQLLVPNSKRLRGYTGDTQERKDLHITSCLQLDGSRKVVNTKIYIQRVVYSAQEKAKQALDRSRKIVNTSCLLKQKSTRQIIRGIGRAFRQRRHQQKRPSFKKEV